MTENQCTDMSVSWLVPEGQFIGTLIECGTYHQSTRAGRKEYYRLVFDVDVEGEAYQEYRAQKRYPVNGKLDEALSKDLVRWLGKEFFTGKTTIQLNDLLGHKATLTIRHLQGEGYSKPFAVVKKIGAVKKPREASKTMEVSTV